MSTGISSLIMSAPTAATAEVADPLAFNLELSGLDCNDQGNARRFIARQGDNFKFATEEGWRVFDGRVWSVADGEDAARRAMHGVIEDVLLEAKACWDRINQIREEPDRSKLDLNEVNDLKARAPMLFKWKVESGMRARYEAGLAVAKPYLTRHPGDFDADPWRVNVQNGTIVFRVDADGVPQDPDEDLVQLRPHDRKDLISRMCAVDYDPQATCPKFLAFLEFVQPDPEIRAFLQRFLGYSLTGLTSEQVLLLNIGEGQNGKSTLYDLVAKIVGNYGASINFESLARDERKRGGEPTPDIARLPGVRFLKTSEPDEGVRLAEAMIKQITGGEAITARHLNKGFFEFYPVFKLIISGNHKPNIRGQDFGIWRRVLLIPWEIIIPKERKDKSLPRKLWAERSGVLNWMLDGARTYVERGLEIPDAIRAATDEYRRDSDPLGEFLAQCLIKSPGQNVGAREMFDAYARWCRANAQRQLQEATFGRRMSDRGYEKRRTSGGIIYSDVSLQNLPPARSRDDGDPGPSEDDIR